MPTSLLAALLGVAPAHLGAVHGLERVVVAVLALAPFAVLAVVVALTRRRRADDDGPDRPA